MTIAKLYNLARVTTATLGTGTVTLGSAVAGHLTFSDAGVQDGDVVSYGIRDGANTEVGRGTYSAAGTTLARTTVSKSTNGGSKINITSGVAEVYITPLAEDFNELAGINAVDYGVVADGSTDDTAAMQSAINDAILKQVALFLPAGNVKITSELAIASPVTIIGFGSYLSKITLGTTTQNGFNITTTGAVNFSDFAIAAAGAQTAGAGVLFHVASQNYFSRFTNILFHQLFTGLDFDGINHFVVQSCMFIECTGKNFKIINTTNSDSGDGAITGCTFQYTSGVTSANVLLYWQSSGGIKVFCNKFLGGYRSVHFDLVSGAQTGSMVVAGNSIENFTDAGILIIPQTSSPVVGVLDKIAISGNEIGGFGDGIPIKVTASSTPAWCDTISVSGNIIATSIDGTGTATQTAVDIDYANNVTIAGNALKGYNSVGTGIKLGSNASNAYAEWTNTYKGFATNVADSSTSVPRTIYRGVTINSNDNPGLVVQSSVAGNASIRMTNTSGGSPGPSFEFFHDTASPAVNDVANSNIGYGRDSSGNQVQYYNFQTLLTSPTAGAYAAQYIMYMAVAGALAQALAVGAGVQVGAPTGGDLGAGNLNVKGVVRSGQFTVATLPSASTMGAGARAFVTDATATTFLSTVAGGGSNKVPVVSNGTNWLIG